MSYWIIDKTRPMIARRDEALVVLTDGANTRLVALTLDSSGRAALAANSYEDGPDVLLLKVAEAWFWKGKQQALWDPADEILTASDIEALVD